MTILGHFRRRQRLIRSFFAVFLLALLQTTLVPCVFAGTQAGQGMSMTGQLAGEITDAEGLQAAAAMPGCMYCPSQHDQSYDVGAAQRDCLYPHESRVDSGKAHQLQLEQLVLHPTFISGSVFGALPLLTDHLPPPRHSIIPIAQRPLALTYCVQLK